ncbi:MAG: hypothetical protein KF893_09960 [Caldilineaceae bacterium]|nr:hypothetical protein [Caldilineaceae bacterium]
MDGLRRQVGSYGMATESALGEQFARLYVEGPPMGIHLLLSFSGVRALAGCGRSPYRARVLPSPCGGGAEDASHTNAQPSGLSLT